MCRFATAFLYLCLIRDAHSCLELETQALLFATALCLVFVLIRDAHSAQRTAHSAQRAAACCSCLQLLLLLPHATWVLDTGYWIRRQGRSGRGGASRKPPPTPGSTTGPWTGSSHGAQALSGKGKGLWLVRRRLAAFLPGLRGRTGGWQRPRGCWGGWGVGGRHGRAAEK
jgi:hypothetical protein